MLRFFPAVPRTWAHFVLLFGSAFLAGNALSDVTYNVRAQTKDVINNAYIYNPPLKTYTLGKAKQGSFGAPSINDKGTVAYACILSGRGITALSNNSVALRTSGNRPSYGAFQAGIILSDTFITDGEGAPGTARMYRISRDVAINNKNQIAYAGELLYLKVPPLASAYTNNVSNYGIALPTNQNKPKLFTALGLVTYNEFNQDIFTKTLSINSRGSTAFNAQVIVAAAEMVPGFGFAFPSFTSIIATTQTPVIGLPYFTTFASFTDAIIADGNADFVVATLTDDGGTDFDGIWQGNNPNIQPVVVKHDTAPSGGTFTSFGGKIGPSRNGKIVAFTATVTSGSSGVFRSKVDGTGIVQVAAIGDTVPTNTAGGNLGSFNSFALAAAGNNGQVAILGTISGSTTTHDGIWLSDKNGQNLTLIVVEGQMLSVNGHDKLVTNIAFNPVSGLNAKGQVAFTASFNDRTSAVIVAKAN